MLLQLAMTLLTIWIFLRGNSTSCWFFEDQQESFQDLGVLGCLLLFLFYCDGCPI